MDYVQHLIDSVPNWTLPVLVGILFTILLVGIGMDYYVKYQEPKQEWPETIKVNIKHVGKREPLPIDEEDIEIS